MPGDGAASGEGATLESKDKAAPAAAENSKAAISAAPVPPVVGDSKLRRGAVAFTWKDVMLSSPLGESTAHDAIFELASVLEAIALWKMARAATLCADSRFGVGGDSVSKVYTSATLHTSFHNPMRSVC